MNKGMILAGSLMAIGAVFMIQQFSYPLREQDREFKFSSTDFIEPNDDFTNCYNTTDCMKVKGSACPASEGGDEACVNKNYFQEYISVIDKLAGHELDVVCPQVYNVTERTCECLNSKCVII
jgi:hypothetical protein